MFYYADFVANNNKRIEVSGSKTTNIGSTNATTEYATFTCDLKGKDVRRVNVAAGETLQSIRY